MSAYGDQVSSAVTDNVMEPTTNLTRVSVSQRNSVELRPREKRHACTEPGCTTTFDSRRDLNRHVRSKHEQHYTPCPKCSKPLRTRSDNMKRHLDRYCKGERN